MDLTPKQKKFADEYIKTGNATESYMRVYKCKTPIAEASSSRLLRNVKVANYIQERNAKLDKATIADMVEIKEFWTKVFRDGTTTTEYDGEQINTIVDIKDRLKASEYIAKTNAAFIEKVDLRADITATITLENMLKDMQGDKF